MIDKDFQATLPHVADEDQKEQWGPLGGPQTAAGVIAMRVAPAAQNGSGAYAGLAAGTDASDGQASKGDVCLVTQPRQVLYNASNSSWNRMREASAATQAATTSRAGVQAVAKAGDWSEVHAPAAATQATVTRAAGGAGVRHVCTGIYACISAAAAPVGPVQVTLLDGAAAVWVGTLAAVAGDSKQLTVDGLSITGTANTAMTLQFAAAGAAGSFETVTLTGYSTS